MAPVWLDMRTRQNFTENLYSVDACVSWGFGDGGFDNFDCCLFTLPVKVKQCKGFRVYYLGPTQACDIAYCSAPTFKGFTTESGLDSSVLSPGQQQEFKPIAKAAKPAPALLLPPSVTLVDKTHHVSCKHSCTQCEYVFQFESFSKYVQLSEKNIHR